MPTCALDRRAVGYVNAGTVEFLQDADTGQCYFIEVNPRIQVEHTVTEMVTGIDLVKAQIRIAEGAAIGAPGSGVPAQADIRVAGHAMQCRVTTEDPENNFIPDYGAITAYGVRPGSASGSTREPRIRARSSRAPVRLALLVKVTAWAPSAEETIARMHRALWEFRVRGVVTNLRFLDRVIMHPRFGRAEYTTRFVDETPELFRYPRKRDRATRLLRFIGEVIVNGHRGEGRGGAVAHSRAACAAASAGEPPPGRASSSTSSGRGSSRNGCSSRSCAAHRHDAPRCAQSLLATRFRTRDMLERSAALRACCRSSFPWSAGAALPSMSLRFLKECPWKG